MVWRILVLTLLVVGVVAAAVVYVRSAPASSESAPSTPATAIPSPTPSGVLTMQCVQGAQLYCKAVYCRGQRCAVVTPGPSFSPPF